MTGNADERAFLTRAFASASILAELGQSNTEPGFSRNGDQLFQYLYGTEETDVLRVRINKDLQGIADAATPVHGEPTGRGPRDADVRVYCTHKRLKVGVPAEDGSERTFDTAIKEYLRSRFDCATALAFTILPHNRFEPDSLQVCPWFLAYAIKQDFQFQNQFRPGVLGSMISALKLDRLATWVKYTPVDLLQLFDKVMVHELSHTRRGGKTVDVGGYKGYGWKNCRTLSTKRGGENVPQNNADSIALFTSISGLINQGGMVNADGTFTSPGDGHNNDHGAQEAGKMEEHAEPASKPGVTRKAALRARESPSDALRFKERWFS
ncbi:hypothetical protein QQS21_004578 [Conoideocrella luteorostrata]|uniref:Uncharacterized protein n=1 Tax=Conoideocrella luteorostrata TaxID=1105319 RepID=A0AAJ0FZR0_9HYPO|nr:hypothetical protein QQS21_004578 [Conoideocrella luteorostrata]